MSPPPDRLRGATIVGTGMYVPDRVLTNFDLEKMVETSDEWIRDRTGIRERADRRARSGVVGPRGHRRASRARDGVGPAGRDRPDHRRDHHARPHSAVVRVHRAGEARGDQSRGVRRVRRVHRLHLRAQHRARRDRQRCRGHRARDRRRAAVAHRGLTRTATPAVLFGDGAGAAVLRPCAPGDGILSVSIQSDGVLGDLLEMPAGGVALPASHETVDQRQHFITHARQGAVQGRRARHGGRAFARRSSHAGSRRAISTS